MRKVLLGSVMISLLASPLALATHELFTRAVVVSVDGKAKTLTCKYTENGKWIQVVSKWDENTEWMDATENDQSPKPTTATLAKSLKNGSKIYLRAVDGRLTLLEVLPPTTVVK